MTQLRQRSEAELTSDIGLKVVTQADAQLFLDTRALNQAFTNPRTSIAVYAVFKPGAMPTNDKLQALGVASVLFSGSVATCTFHGVKVHESARGEGIGDRLFKRLHSLVFEIVQDSFLRPRKVFVLPAEISQVREHSVHSTFSINYVLAPGDCFRKPPSLLLYQRNGAIVTQNAGSVLLTRDTLISAIREAQSYEHKDISVDFVPVSFKEPYLIPSAHSSVSWRWSKPSFTLSHKKEAVPSHTHTHESEPHTHESEPKRDPYPQARALETPKLLLSSECPSHDAHSFVLSETLRAGDWSLDDLPAEGRAGHLFPSNTTGMCSFLIQAGICHQMEQFLLASTCFTTKPLVIGDVKLTGYEQYGIVQGAHRPIRQLERTKCARSSLEVDACLDGIPGLLHIVGQCRELLRSKCNLIEVHFLKQDELQQTTFGWHNDAATVRVSDNEAYLIRTVIVQLSDQTHTGMCMFGFRPHTFLGRGAAVVFHGGAMHTSLSPKPWPADSSAYKLALFFVLSKS